MAGVTYDAGALVAAERRSRTMWAIHRQVLSEDHQPTVPAGVLAQAWRGGPQASLSRFLRPCRIEPLTEVQARAVGAALAVSGTSDIVDASVVIGAALRGDVIVSSDRRDLEQVANGLQIDVQILDV